MLTRRENLLIRPWQERRYINHRNKVEHALPAIDVKPPAKRAHVICKLKKLQKEAERCARIEQDNFTLLQHLRSIMHSSRVDNIWNEAPPNFLHRVGIYGSINGSENTCKDTDSFDPPTNRKERCVACSPNRIDKMKKIPEERIPWDPPRPRLSRRRSDSVGMTKKENIQNTKCDQEIAKKRSPSSCPSTGKQNHKSRSQTCKSGGNVNHLTPNKTNKSHNKKLPNIETQSIVLSRGALRLAVNFPPHTTVILKDGATEKVLQSEYCHCNGIKPF
ncbi:uncharacterized protein LOC142320233 [Lycorma delicatula]|uniref:uncharacterized protein LOC142320233 n=1 Tax=Lycorma delicatula TaxID=130591 RepID=UPI003F515475